MNRSHNIARCDAAIGRRRRAVFAVPHGAVTILPRRERRQLARRRSLARPILNIGFWLAVLAVIGAVSGRR